MHLPRFPRLARSQRTAVNDGRFRIDDIKPARQRFDDIARRVFDRLVFENVMPDGILRQIPFVCALVFAGRLREKRLAGQRDNA